MNAGKVRRSGLLNLRPASPWQLALAGLALVLLGTLIPGLNVLATLGAVALAIAAISSLFRPRPRISYWRGRPIDLSDGSSLRTRLYRMLYRR